ncbi:MAG TPA: putative S-layer protein [Candidatus Nanoarchaeia archaeon]|nr:putative S-layer protein [Candidatus Nanoarchaeia archaeon]
MRLIHLLITFLLVSVAVSAQSFVVDHAKVTAIVEPGSSSTAVFTISNTGSVDLQNFNFTHNIDLTDNDGDVVNLSFSDPGTVSGNSTANVTMTFSAPIDLDFESFSGQVTVTSGSLTDTFDLEIISQPVVCDSGLQGNDLVLTIKDPDSKDDFKPGDDVKIKVNVKNINQDKSHDVQVEAFLFDDESEVTNDASEIQNIDNLDDEDFEFTLRIPTDNDDFEKVGDLMLIVKAYEEDNEDLECNQASTEVKIELENDDLVIEDTSRFDPSSASCGQLAVATINLINIGEDNQRNIILSLTNPKLNIREKLPSFDLDKFDSDENNEVTKRIQVSIPNSAPSGDYVFDAVAEFSGKKVSKSFKLSVLSCTKALPFVEAGNAEFSALTSLFTVEQGDLITIPVKLTNNDNTGLFNLNFANFEDFAEPVSSKTITLSQGQSSTIFLNLRVRDNTEPGRYSVTVNLASGAKTIASDTVAVDVKERVEPSFSFKQLSGSFWLALDIIIALVLIIFIITIIVRRK